MQRDDVRVIVQQESTDEARWLALTIRRGLLLICKAIEERYGLNQPKGRS